MAWESNRVRPGDKIIVRLSDGTVMVSTYFDAPLHVEFGEVDVAWAENLARDLARASKLDISAPIKVHPNIIYFVVI